MREVLLARALALAMLAGILVAWTPRYWAETVAVVSLSAIAIAWAVTAADVQLANREVRIRTMIVTAISLWGPFQLAFHSSAVPWLTTLSSLTWMMGGVAFIVSSQVLRSQRNQRAFLDALLWAVTALAVAAIVQMYGTPGRVFGIFPAASSVVGTFFYKNQFAALLELIAPIALWKVYSGEVIRGGLCYAAMCAAAVTSASRAGVILLLAEFVILLIVMIFGGRIRLKPAAAVAALLLLLAAGALAVAGTERIWSRFEEPHPYALRAMLLDSTLKMIRVHPWAGSGLGTWHAVYPQFATFDSTAFINEAHNDWVQWASEGGLPFSALLAALVIGLIKPAIRTVWGSGLLVVMIHSFVDYPLGEPVLKFLWFAMAGAVCHSGERDARDSINVPGRAQASSL